MTYVKGLMDYIDQSPSNYHSIANQRKQLEQYGFVQLKENESWEIEAGNKYYVNRNNSALIAFSIPKTVCKAGESEHIYFNITASHCDSPALKIKNNPDITVENYYVKLNVEGYGGAIWHTWIDRPLSIAGRVFVEGEKECRLVDIKRDICMIPSLAIHMNRDINKGYEWNIQKDLLPLLSINPDTKLMDIVADSAGVSVDRIIGHDLYLYNRNAALLWGMEDEFLSAPRLDDQACAYASLVAICESVSEEESNFSSSVKVHAVFDNEEVGSSTIQGACSTFLKDTLERIVDCLGLSREEYHRAISDSFMLSLDNAHAIHPNYTEKCDPTNRPLLGNGIVLKFAGNQKYTTDGASAAKVRSFAKASDINLQTFHNKSDMAGGSTLGNLSANQVPVSTADIGIGQLAMHSCYETIAASDVKDIIKLIKTMYMN